MAKQHTQAVFLHHSDGQKHYSPGRNAVRERNRQWQHQSETGNNYPQADQPQHTRPGVQEAKRGRTNFSSWRATLIAPVRSWSDRAVDRRRCIMKRGSHGSRPIARDVPIKPMAIPKGIDRPGIATKQNGNANRMSKIAEPRPLSACFNSASVSALSFTRACSVSRSVDRRDWKELRSVIIVN